MIFFVTEDQRFLDMMIGHLQKKGKRARGIANTEELWVRLRETSPDIIILDGNCPHFDALEILKDLKAEGYKGQTIVLGGSSSAPLDPEVSRFGAIQTAGRPLAVDRVLGAIRIAGEHLKTDRGRSSGPRTEINSGSHVPSLLT
ncbi:MAG: response regulator [Nitrospirales bacterium]|nr:response regulator [Nitrospirales bacterium]